jgi:hypothetical protein
VEADGQQDVARRARRALWIFRLTFYPAAIAVAVALLAARGGDEPPELKTYTGWTTQGFRIFLGERDDRPVFVETTVNGPCAAGGSRTFHWASSEDPDAIRVDGPWLHTGYEGPWFYDDESVSQVRLDIDGTLTGDELSGTIIYRERFDGGADCASDRVRFAVRR